MTSITLLTRGAAADAPRAFELSGGYLDQHASAGVCNAGKTRRVVGHEPTGGGPYPLFVYLTGTRMRFDGPEAQAFTQEMAKRGFVAASVEYDNGAYAYCNSMRAKADCVFGKAATESAVSKLCARKNVDCGRGIVVSGFSQGANLAFMSRSYDPRVQGAFLLGHGHRAGNFMDVTACQRAGASGFSPAQVRSINGEHDGFFGNITERVRKQLEVVTGKSCGQSLDCIAPDGSGFYVIQDAQLTDGSADHCYFFDAADGFCAKFKGLDPKWRSSSEPWALGPSLDWLAARIAPRSHATAAR